MFWSCVLLLCMVSKKQLRSVAEKPEILPRGSVLFSAKYNPRETGKPPGNAATQDSQQLHQQTSLIYCSLFTPCLDAHMKSSSPPETCAPLLLHLNDANSIGLHRVLQHGQLSPLHREAVGLQLMSRPDEVHVSQEHLKGEAGDGGAARSWGAGWVWHPRMEKNFLKRKVTKAVQAPTRESAQEN